MISKIFNSVSNFMSNPYVVVILTIITDVYMAMDDGIYSLGDAVFYIIIMPLILMLFFKCMPFMIGFCIGLVIGLVLIIYALVIMIISFVFDINLYAKSPILERWGIESKLNIMFPKSNIIFLDFSHYRCIIDM